jgi:hypothetical protein
MTNIYKIGGSLLFDACARSLIAAASAAAVRSAPLEPSSSEHPARCVVVRLWSTIMIFSLLPAVATPVVAPCVVAAVMSAAAAGSGRAAAGFIPQLGTWNIRLLKLLTVNCSAAQKLRAGRS